MSTLTLEERVAILEQELLLLKRQMRPVAALPFWQTATPQERAAAARQWAALERPAAPPIPDEALHREQMYQL